MKWTFRLRHKNKTALLFLAVLVIILGCSFLENWYMSEMNRSVSSIYKDRLIPEADLLHINDNMHSRRLLLEKYLISPGSYSAHAVAGQLSVHQHRIDSLITNYENTYLIAEESKLLKTFKVELSKYNKLEAAFFVPSEPKIGLETYQQKMEPVFIKLHSELIALSNIQTTVGKELLHDSEVTQGSAYSLGYLQIAVVTAIAFTAIALLLNSRPILPKKMQNFHLN